MSMTRMMTVMRPVVPVMAPCGERTGGAEYKRSCDEKCCKFKFHKNVGFVFDYENNEKYN